MKEEWRKIPGINTHTVSSRGRVKRIIAPLNHHKARVLKGYVIPDGYLRFCIRCNGKNHLFFAHQLVALAFLGPRPSGMEINHIDGDKSNNNPYNLEYCTTQENNHHAGKLGLKARGEFHGKSKLSVEQVYMIREKLDSGITQKTIASEFSVSRSAIQQIANGYNWKWLPIRRE